MLSYKVKKDYSKPFVSKIEERLVSDFSSPNLNSDSALYNDFASLSRYLKDHGLSNSKIAEALDVNERTVAKWTAGINRKGS